MIDPDDVLHIPESMLVEQPASFKGKKSLVLMQTVLYFGSLLAILWMVSELSR